MNNTLERINSRITEAEEQLYNQEDRKRIEAKIEKKQEMFTKDLQELKNKQ